MYLQKAVEVVSSIIMKTDGGYDDTVNMIINAKSEN